ncbi:MAG: hypothetical protein JEY99_04540 [Spirochaetales bacterium]|nr:hypothetical protein [Spirochaetales bacterium]
MKEEKCTSDHSNHVCQLIAGNNKDIDKIIGLVENPKFICFNCARVAERKENLCNPMPIDN